MPLKGKFSWVIWLLHYKGYNLGVIVYCYWILIGDVMVNIHSYVSNQVKYH